MFGKRKDRPKTVGDSSTSPEDQRSRQTFIVEYPDKEDDDEALKALSVAIDLGKKLDEVLDSLGWMSSKTTEIIYTLSWPI